MGLRFKCPNCGKDQQVFDRGLGENVLCSACGKEVEIPSDPQFTVHVPDPPEVIAEIRSHEAAETALKNREISKKFILWFFVILNPIIGSMKLLTYFMRPDSKSPMELFFGISLICLTPFAIVIQKRKKWGVLGCMTIYGMLAAWTIARPSYDAILNFVISIGFFIATANSVWGELK